MDRIKLYNYHFIYDKMDLGRFFVQLKKCIKVNEIITLEIDKISYVFIVKKIESDTKFLSICLDYGSNRDYSKEVVEIENKVIKANPKKKTQVEYPKQLIVVFIQKTNELYLTYKDKKVFEEFMRNLNFPDFKAENILKTKEEFIKEISVLKEIRLTSKKNLLSDLTELSNDVFSRFGLNEEIEQFSIDLKLNSTKKNIITDLINNLVLQKEKNEIDSLVCVGQSNESLTKVFNISNFTQNIEIEVFKNEENKFDYDLSLQSIHSKIHI